MNRKAYEALPGNKKKEGKNEEKVKRSVSGGPTFHVTEYLRKAAALKAQGEKLDAETEMKLREVLSREVEVQDLIIEKKEKELKMEETQSEEEKRKKEEEKKEKEKEEEMKRFLAIDLSYDHNCREEREKIKLQEAHPDELDVVICKREDACYIKGKLQPTRSIGDFYLKYSEFMRHASQHNSAGKEKKRKERMDLIFFCLGRYISPPYTPPYITATPEVLVQKLRPGSKKERKKERIEIYFFIKVDDFFVMATDGLWDFLSSQEAIDIAGKKNKERKKE